MLIEHKNLSEVSGYQQAGAYPATRDKPYLRPAIFTSPWILVDDSEASQGVIYVRQIYDGYIIFKEFSTNSEKE